MLSDFDDQAEHYDLFEHKNEELHRTINSFLIDFFKKQNVHRIIDFSCGTGAQVTQLSRFGFDVVGVDISPNMIERAKSKIDNNSVSLIVGDVRSLQVGIFDACIMILNSIGYLDKEEFRQALANISNNLTDDGYFVFDNTNREAIEKGGLFGQKFIDTAAEVESKKIVRFATTKYDQNTGIARWDWESFVQEGFTPIIQRSGSWIRQTYTITEIETILAEHHIRILNVCDRNLTDFIPARSFAYLVVAQKITNL
jgi:SAM-dependent methyltransferase